ncbi:MAG: lysozyme inhibitor LprI family protein [Erythrobacter sp.]|jgi:uncharacterized protein YecT (DUF1311 family)|nr:lysozyme inhibitor LprI family protein [Erythrobacter sp.]
MLNAMMILAGLAQQPPPVADWNCEDPTRQQEMNWCAAREFEEADAALNEAWSRARARTRAQDADYASYQPEGDERPGHFASLLEAQRAWLTFRDAHCRIDGYTARGGTLEPLLVSTCKTALTKARTDQLEAIAQGPE